MCSDSQKKFKDIYSDDFVSMITSGLIALHFNHKHNLSPYLKSTFLGKWLKTSLKRKWFARSISEQIKSMIFLYQKHSATVDLARVFHQIYYEHCMSEVRFFDFKTDEVSRLKLAIEHMQKIGWILLEKNNGEQFHQNHFFIDDVSRYESTEKQLKQPVTLFTTVDNREFIDVFYQFGLVLCKEKTINAINKKYTIHPNNYCNRDIEIPSDIENIKHQTNELKVN
jgi:hypothetical protein